MRVFLPPRSEGARHAAQPPRQCARRDSARRLRVEHRAYVCFQLAVNAEPGCLRNDGASRGSVRASWGSAKTGAVWAGVPGTPSSDSG